MQASLLDSIPLRPLDSLNFGMLGAKILHSGTQLMAVEMFNMMEGMGSVAVRAEVETVTYQTNLERHISDLCC